VNAAGSDSGPTWSIPLSDVSVDQELREAAAEAVASGWWSMGPRVAEFERAFAEATGTPHAFALSSGTAALHLGLAACGCGPGDEVVLPSLNFVAAANTIRHTGATPVFCDISGPSNLNLDPNDLEAALTPRTKAIVALHYGGFPCDMQRVDALAGERGIALVEDAAHAVGATVDGRPCGSVGQVGCFSFFANKNLPLGEGGMLITSDAGVAESVRKLRSHGMTTLTWDRHLGHAHSYDVVAAGYNYRLDEIRAAMGLVQLRRLVDGNDLRGRLHRHYCGLLDGRAGITVPFAKPVSASGTRSSYHLAVVLLPEGIEREAVRGALAREGIQTSVHYPPIHNFTAYRDVGRPRPLPVTEHLEKRLLTLPLYPTLGEERVKRVAEALLAAVTALAGGAAPLHIARALEG
jgi:dTDP-4-amino-4,6-dideoxygalactose transaminase